MSSPIALIIGAGPGIGAGVIKAFAAKGYRVASAARSLQDETTSDGQLKIKVDLSSPDNVKPLFEKVKEKLGAPSVVVYNAALFTHDGQDPILGFSTSALQSSLAINVSSVILAMAESIKGFRELPATAAKTFIFTGNMLNVNLIPGMMTFGIAKGAAAYAIRTAASTELYTKEGMKFYYADERTPEGRPVGQYPSGEGAGKTYVSLAEGKEQVEWDYTFVKDKGLVKF